MNLIRLGDRLDEASQEKRKPYFRAADNLAKYRFALNHSEFLLQLFDRVGPLDRLGRLVVGLDEL